jgi:hypothetical protein
MVTRKHERGLPVPERLDTGRVFERKTAGDGLIHGGAYVRGSSSLPLYNGSALAKKGVVVVTFNYRIGVLGFMTHPQLSKESPHNTSGNYALLDQEAALRWVQQHSGLRRRL